MNRRQFFMAIGAIPVVSRGNAREYDRPYTEPFKGYSDYIRRLGGYVGENVSVCDSRTDGFYVTVGGHPLEKLLSVSRETIENLKLFPHSVSFDNGMTYNLKNVMSITIMGGEGIKFTRGFEDQGILYLNVPAHEAIGKQIKERIINHMAGVFGKNE